MTEQSDLEIILALVPRIRRALNCPFPEAHLVGQPLSMSQYGAMAFLWRSPGATLSEVARELDISLGSASDLVDRLVDLDLLERQTNRADRRQIQLSLTEPARARIEAMLRDRRRQFELVRSNLSEPEWDGFSKGLAAWADVLDRDAARKHDPGNRLKEASGD
jgi:MarR family transcriptional regulator for hemolysin